MEDLCMETHALWKKNLDVIVNYRYPTGPRLLWELFRGRTQQKFIEMLGGGKGETTALRLIMIHKRKDLFQVLLDLGIWEDLANKLTGNERLLGDEWSCGQLENKENEVQEEMYKAARTGNRNTISAILSSHHSSPIISANALSTALLLATEYGNVEIMDLLWQYGADPRIAKKSRGSNMLTWALYSRSARAVKKTIEMCKKIGTDYLQALLNMERRETASEPMLVLAVATGNVCIIQMLLKEKPKLHLLNSDGHSALHLACILGYCQMAKLLLWAGADPHMVTSFSEAISLYDTDTKSYKDIVSVWEDCPDISIATVKIGETSSYSVRDCAVCTVAGEEQSCRARNGKELDVALASQVALVAMCGHHYHLDCLEKWLRESLSCPLHCGELYVLEGGGWNALHLACNYGKLDVAELLVWAGADPDMGTLVENYTPLHLAQKRGHRRIAKFVADVKKKRVAQHHIA